MKLKMIESPKSDVQIAGLTLSSILTDGHMKSVIGGGGIYSRPVPVCPGTESWCKKLGNCFRYCIQYSGPCAYEHGCDKFIF